MNLATVWWLALSNSMTYKESLFAAASLWILLHYFHSLQTYFTTPLLFAMHYFMKHLRLHCRILLPLHPPHYSPHRMNQLHCFKWLVQLPSFWRFPNISLFCLGIKAMLNHYHQASFRKKGNNPHLRVLSRKINSKCESYA